MRYITNVTLSIKGDRIEKGEEIDLTDEEVAHIDPADLSPADGASEAPEEPEEEVALEDMNSAQLKARAKKLGLSAGGSAADIRERIKLQGNKEPEAPEEPAA